MAIVMMPLPVDTLSDVSSNYSVYAEMRAGSNGDTNGDPEQILSTSSTGNAGRFVWDSTDSDGGFNAISIPVLVDINLRTGADTLSMGDGSAPVTLSGPSGKTVNFLELVAGTQVNAKVAWSNVQVSFYKNGTLQETASVSGGPSIDTTSSDAPTGEQIATVQPADTDDDEIIVTGSITMVCPDFTYPNPQDIFAQAFVFANA